MSDQTTPILVGVAQVQQKISDYTQARQPLDLMIDAVRTAAQDAGSSALMDQASSVRVVRGLWPYRNPAAAVAEAIGASRAETALTQFGGNFVQTTVNHSCLDIQAGTHDVIVVTGAECGYTQAKARKAQARPDWSECPGTPDRMIGEDVPMLHPHERDMGMMAPILWYPLIENALRASRGESIEQHLDRICELWARFSRVAADNPHAWIRTPVTARELRTISPSNRPVSFPYSKLLNSNNSVDMGAALIFTSIATARKLGIPRERWVYPHSGTDAHDTYIVSNRDQLHRSAAIRIAGRRALELAQMTAAEVDHVDVYSCFPVAVQVGASEIGLDIERPLTVTGGLTFNGGPLNNYVMHSVARMAEVLRKHPGERGLITANGGYLTKHAFGVYGTEPPEVPFRHEDVQEVVDATPTRVLLESHVGPATVEGYTVMYGAEGPDTAYMTCLTASGERALAKTRDPAIMTSMTRREFCGAPVTIDADAEARF